jgi:hypothetical protein
MSNNIIRKSILKIEDGSVTPPRKPKSPQKDGKNKEEEEGKVDLHTISLFRVMTLLPYLFLVLLPPVDTMPRPLLIHGRKYAVYSGRTSFFLSLSLCTRNLSSCMSINRKKN